MGYTIYNAKRYSGQSNELALATAHYNYAKQIPETIKNFIDPENIIQIDGGALKGSIGENAVIHTHNTLPSMSQKYHMPMWKLPGCDTLEPDDRGTIAGNQKSYLATEGAYATFAKDFLVRVERLHD
jgi:hypothetical protein